MHKVNQQKLYGDMTTWTTKIIQTIYKIYQRTRYLQKTKTTQQPENYLNNQAMKCDKCSREYNTPSGSSTNESTYLKPAKATTKFQLAPKSQFGKRKLQAKPGYFRRDTIEPAAQ